MIELVGVVAAAGLLAASLRVGLIVRPVRPDALPDPRNTGTRWPGLPRCATRMRH